MKNDNKTDDRVGRKDPTKGKVIIFAAGVLLGAIISISAFVIGVNVSNNNQPNLRSSGMQRNLPSNMHGNRGNSQRQLPMGNNDANNNKPDSQPKDNNSQPNTENNAQNSPKKQKS